MEEKSLEEIHTQLKAKCLSCDLHFIVCTEYPDRHNAKSLYCPECGQHEGNFLTWASVVASPIRREVPGDARPTDDMQATGVKAVKVKNIVETT